MEKVPAYRIDIETVVGQRDYMMFVAASSKDDAKKWARPLMLKSDKIANVTGPYMKERGKIVNL